MTALPGRRAIASVSEAQYAAEAVNWADCNPRQLSAPKTAGYERLQQCFQCRHRRVHVGSQSLQRQAARDSLSYALLPPDASRVRRACKRIASGACLHPLALICNDRSLHNFLAKQHYICVSNSHICIKRGLKGCQHNKLVLFFLSLSLSLWRLLLLLLLVLVVLVLLVHAGAGATLRMRCGCAGVYAGTGAGSGPSTLGKPWVRPWSCWKPIGKSLARYRGRGQPGQDASPSAWRGCATRRRRFGPGRLVRQPAPAASWLRRSRRAHMVTKPLTALMLRPTYFGSSCSSPMSSAPGFCSLSAQRLVHNICSATYPQPTSCRTLAVTTMRSGRQLKACWATNDPARETTGLLLARSLFCRRAWEASVSWQRSRYHRQHTGRRGQMRSRCCANDTPTQQPG